MSKFVNLEQIKVLANKVKSEDAALGTKLETVTAKVDNLVATDEEAQQAAATAVAGAQATDTEFNAAMNEVWTPSEG